jgi:hypothetical protein
MCGNPFKIAEKVDGNFTVDKATTSIESLSEIKLKWHTDEGGYEYLTLNEILEQVIEQLPIKHTDTGKEVIPFIRVHYESGLWGVIFEAGNYTDIGRQWIVHGVTKGYA